MNDLLESLEPTDPARATVMALTLAVVRRRRRMRRVASIVAVAAAYAVGLATPRLLDGARAAPADPIQGAAHQARSLSKSPRDFESQAAAAAAPSERASLLKAAGDRYLSDLGDVEAALGCYRETLELTPAADRRRFDPNDTWLLGALKLAAE
jgi:hypothetical protein